MDVDWHMKHTFCSVHVLHSSKVQEFVKINTEHSLVNKTRQNTLCRHFFVVDLFSCVFIFIFYFFLQSLSLDS